MRTRVAPIGLGLVLSLALAASNAWADPMEGLDQTHPILVDKNQGEIRILADLRPQALSGGWFPKTPGHHAVVWRGGGAAGEALLKADVSDAEFYDAMVSLGAKPGDNVPQAAWDKRFDKNSTAPAIRVEGSPVEVSVWWKGLASPLPLQALLNDPSGKGIDLRFGGNVSSIPIWKSGCIVCLQSCPSGKISNRSYTIRDYVEGKATFSVNEQVVPKGDRNAVVIVRVKRGPH